MLAPKSLLGLLFMASLLPPGLGGGASGSWDGVPCQSAFSVEYWCCNVPGGKALAASCSWMDRWPIDWCPDAASDGAVTAWCERANPRCGCRCTEMPYVTFDSYRCSVGPYLSCGNTPTLTCFPGRKPLMCVNGLEVPVASKCGCPEGEERDGVAETCRAAQAPAPPRPTAATPAPSGTPAPSARPGASPSPAPRATATPSPRPVDLGPLRNATSGAGAVGADDIGGLELDAISPPTLPVARLGDLGIACTGRRYENRAEYLDAMADAYDAMARHYGAIAADLAVAGDGFSQQCRVCANAIAQVSQLGLGPCDARLGSSSLSPERVAAGGIGPAICHEAALARCEARELKACRPAGNRTIAARNATAAAPSGASAARDGARLLLPLAGMVPSQVRNYAADTGMDVHVPVGTPVQAVADGTLVYSERGHTPWTTPPDTPNSILLKLDRPFAFKGKTWRYAWYTHLGDLAYQVPDGGAGRRVAAGTRLGTTGRGNSVAHLHFGILTDRAQGPGQYLAPDDIVDYYFGSGIASPIAATDMMLDVPALAQANDRDCGVTSVQMIAQFFGGGMDAATLERERNAQLISLPRAALAAMPRSTFAWETMPLDAYGRQRTAAEWDRVRREVARGRPVLLHVRGEASGHHYVVVRGFKAGRVVVNDPNGGRVREFALDDEFVGYIAGAYKNEDDSFGYFDDAGRTAAAPSTPNVTAGGSVDGATILACPLCAAVPCSVSAGCGTGAARTYVTAPALLASCQQALADVRDACTVDGSDVIAGTPLDPCSMKARVEGDRDRLSSLADGLVRAARELRAMADDVSASVRDGLPPKEMDRRIAALIDALEATGGTGASVGRFQNGLSALVSLTGDPLIRDVGGGASSSLPSNRDIVGFRDTGTTTTARYAAARARSTASLAAAPASGADPSLMSARVGFRGNDTWSGYCGRLNLAQGRGTGAAASSAATLSPRATQAAAPAAMTVARVLDIVRAATSEPPSPACVPPGLCESELVAGARSPVLDADEWSPAHLSALYELASLDPARLFIDVRSCFRYAANASSGPPGQDGEAASAPEQCGEGCELCLGTRGSHCHPELGLCMCHTSDGVRAIDLACDPGQGEDALALARACCSAAGGAGSSAAGGSGSRSTSDAAVDLLVCQTPARAGRATFDLCAAATSETGLCCLDGLAESPVGTAACEERENLTCEEGCLSDERGDDAAALACIRRCKGTHATAPSPAPAPDQNATSGGGNATSDGALACKRACLASSGSDAALALACVRACGGGACEERCARERPTPALLRPCLEGCAGAVNASTGASCEERCVVRFGAGAGEVDACVGRCGEVGTACEEGCLGDAATSGGGEALGNVTRECLAACGKDAACGDDGACLPANATALCIDNCTRSGGRERECVRSCKALAPSIAITDLALLRGTREARTFYATELVRVRAVVNNTGAYAFEGRAAARLRVIASCDCPPCPEGYECACACDERRVPLLERAPGPIEPGGAWAFLSNPVALDASLANTTIQLELEVLDGEGASVAGAAAPLAHVLEMGGVTVTAADFADASSGAAATVGHPGMDVSGRITLASAVFPVRVETFMVIGAGQEVAMTRSATTLDGPADGLVVPTRPLRLTGEHLGWVLHLGVRLTDGAGTRLLDTVLDEQGFDTARCEGSVMTSWCVSERSRVRLGYPLAYLEVRRPLVRVADAAFLDGDGRAARTAAAGETVTFEVRLRNLEHLPFTGLLAAWARREGGTNVTGAVARADAGSLARGDEATLRSPPFVAFPDAGGEPLRLHVSARDEGGALWLDEDVDSIIFPFSRLSLSEGASHPGGRRGPIETTLVVGSCHLDISCDGCLPSCELHVDREACTLATRSCGCECATRRR